MAFPITAACIALICCVLQIAAPAVGLAQVRPPNIILVMADDLGYGDVGPYGQTRFPTPAIDRMAAEGLRFTQFYSASAECAPAREALMTGRHTGHTMRQRNDQRPLRPATITIAKRLQAAGYRTAIIGKWALGHLDTSGEPSRQGFDHSFGFLDQGDAHSHYPVQMFRNGVAIPYPGNRRTEGEAYSNDEFTREAVQFIRESVNRLFFIYLPLTLPHADMIAPPGVVAEFSGKFSEIPFAGGHYAPQDRPNATYAAMVTLIDRTIATLMQTLTLEGLDDNTVLLFTSDNGPVNAGGRDLDFFASRGGLKGEKRTLYEGGIRVPMLVRWPGTIKPGVVLDTPAYFPDLFPSFLELAGQPTAVKMDGRSLVTTLKAPNTTPSERTLYWAWQGPSFRGGDPGKAENWGPEAFLEAARVGRWKAVRTNRRSPPELYDVEADPQETMDAASLHPDIAAKLEAIMGEEFSPSSD